jgi:hypothetical protein
MGDKRGAWETGGAGEEDMREGVNRRGKEGNRGWVGGKIFSFVLIRHNKKRSASVAVAIAIAIAVGSGAEVPVQTAAATQ